MEDTILMEHPQQTIDQVREATALLELIPRLLEENDRLRAAAQVASREAEEMRAELAPLRVELERLRAEREELGEAFGRAMGEMGSILGEPAARVRPSPRSSPFARDPHGNGHGLNGSANGAAVATSQH